MKKDIYKISEKDTVIILYETINENIFLLESFIKEMQNGNHKLRLPNGKEDVSVLVCEILFIEFSCNKLHIHMRDKSFAVASRLCEMEKNLPSYFVKISKSIIVNMNHLQSIKKERNGIGTVQLSGDFPPLWYSRMYYKNIKEYLDKKQMLLS